MMNSPLYSTSKKDLSVQKTIARNHLSNNRLPEAVEAYASLIHFFPHDIESYLVLGDLYLAAEDSTAALALYLKARMIEPDNHEVASRIELAEIEDPQINVQIDPLQKDRLFAMIEKLTGKKQVVRKEELEQASQLLEEIVQSNNPAELVAAHLEQIDSLLPALLELNIRQAESEHRPDLVSGLENLQEAIVSGNPQLPSFSSYRGIGRADPAQAVENISLLVPAADRPSPRVQFIQECLHLMGKQVEVISSTDSARTHHPQLVIACNPHANPWLLEYMAECTAHQIPTILELDADYEQMPLNHPHYLEQGLGFPTNARAYSAALLLSNLVTTPSNRFSEQLNRSGYQSIAVPDGWSRTNFLWEKPNPKRNTINIGWIGGSGMLDDLLEIRRILIRVIREFPRTMLVIAEDQKAYQLFESIPENRKLFLPEVPPDDYPYLLGQLDILMVPLRNIPYNYTQSDTLLMQAGVKYLPWIGSRLPMTMEWNAGGLLASSLDEWHTNLRQLVMEDETRQKLGEAGFQKAKTREAAYMVEKWHQALSLAMDHPGDRGFLTQNQTQVSAVDNP